MRRLLMILLAGGLLGCGQVASRKMAGPDAAAGGAADKAPQEKAAQQPGQPPAAKDLPARKVIYSADVHLSVRPAARA